MTKNISQSDYGLFVSIYLLIITFYPIISFGLFDYGIDIYEKENFLSYLWFKKAFKIILYLSLIFLILSFTYSYLFISNLKTFYLVIILSFSILGQMMFELTTIRFKLYNDYLHYSLWNLIPNLIRLILLYFYFLIFPKYKIYEIALIYSFSALIITILGIYILRKFYNNSYKLYSDYIKNNTFNTSNNIIYIKDVFYKGIPYSIIPFLFLIYYQSDVYIIKFYLGNDAAAIYNIAFIFLAVSFLIPNSIQKIIIQRIHNLFYNDLNEYLKLQIYNTLFMLLLGLIIMLIIFILGYFVILNLLDKNYFQSIAILKILILCVPIHFASKIFDVSLQVSKFIKNKLYILLFAAILNLILNIVFIPKYGAISAAYTTLLTELSLLLIFISLFTKNYIKYSK